MSTCEYFAVCTFFAEHMSSMPSTAVLTQSNYCKNNYTACARYRVDKALGVSAVPSDLSPSESERADKIIAAARG
jgi:hypothetical protein